MSKKHHKYLKAKPLMPQKQKLTIIGLGSAIAAVLLLIIVLIVMMNNGDPAPTEPTEVTETTVATEKPTVEVTEETVPTEPEREMLPHMAELYAQNPDIIGWVQIEDTKLDYPVMYTPDEKWKYDRLDFEGNFSIGGTPYLNEECNVDKPTVNLLIYGHNMMNGTQFAALHKYDNRLFWEEHPTIKFTTLYEEREYEIMAAFYDRIYLKSETCFKYYNWLDPQTEEEFNEGYEYFKSHCLYDTGVEAEFGDQFITLVTCAYHVEDGRFVLIGKLVEDEPVEETTAPTE